ncbi:hypothetical protein [Streptomyces sp. fd1-xmd]|uniref:hypothetical protein n=1 Tax=Streptomyces sp. fd1-xmd TaxID=1812480 RepID=UPI0013520902|nr:hypothetical protein [Streptomyces sp. fd1-xmd]
MTYDSKPGTPGGGQGAAVHVTLPRLDGAGVQRRGGRCAGGSGVSDCNVDIRHHPHAGEQDVR